MTRLTVFYDDRCGLCCAVRDWIAQQRQLLPLTCVAKPREASADELVVTADTGEFWSGDTAWLMVLWALDDYRSWSYRLATPALLPSARATFAILSKYRGTLSCAIGLPAQTS
jgi:predicted DCC family thiol-disulfide oxidoreductase YuxK